MPLDPDPLTVLDDADGEEPYKAEELSGLPSRQRIGQAAVLLICAALLVALWWVNRP